MNKYICTICDHIEECSVLPQKYPNCGVPSTSLKVLTEAEFQALAQNPKYKSMVETMSDSIVLRGYNPNQDPEISVSYLQIPNQRLP